MELVNRELEERDIDLITGYWASMTPDDFKRMYVDVTKLFTKEQLGERLTGLLKQAPEARVSDPLIWEVDQKAVGMTNLNNITRGEQANIHLHVFDSSNRGRGFGRMLFMLSVKKYLDRHQLKKVICEPAATNPSPNGLMRALGIPISGTYFGSTPSVICFPHDINRYEIDRAMADRILARLGL